MRIMEELSVEPATASCSGQSDGTTRTSTPRDTRADRQSSTASTPTGTTAVVVWW